MMIKKEMYIKFLNKLKNILIDIFLYIKNKFFYLFKIVFPNKSQWISWDYFGKLTYIGTVIGFIGLFFSIYSMFSSDENIKSLRENEKLYRDSKIRFEQFESNVRSIIQSKSIALNYLSSDYSNQFHHLYDMKNKHGEKFIDDVESGLTGDLRDFQNIVIAIGFTKSEDINLFNVLDRRIYEIGSPIDYISDSDTREERIRKVSLLINNMDIAKDQKDLLLNALNNADSDTLDELYSELRNFVSKSSEGEMFKVYESLTNLINIKRYDNDNDRIRFILSKSQYIDKLAISSSQYDMIDYYKLFHLVPNENYFCDIPPRYKINNIDKSTESILNESCIDYIKTYNENKKSFLEERIFNWCQNRDKFIESEIKSWENCVDRILLGKYECIIDNYPAISNQVIEYAKTSESIDDIEYWINLINNIGNENGMTYDQFGFFSNTIISEKIKMYLLYNDQFSFLEQFHERKRQAEIDGKPFCQKR